MSNEHDDTREGAAEAESPPKFDARLAEGVAYFEQMLEIMPDDRTTLEFLVVAYDQLNEHEKGQKALVSLTRLLIRDGDTEALSGLLPRLEASDYPPAKALFLKVSAMTAPEPDLTPEKPRELSDEERTTAAMRDAVAAERALGDLLRDAGLLDDGTVEDLRAHLEASSYNGTLFLISALQFLEKENAKRCERCIEHLADRFNAPPVPLASFDVPPSVAAALPREIALLRGVVPFAKIGRLTLAATLNPADESLRATLAGLGEFRLFMAEPSAVEAAVEKLYTPAKEGG